MVVAGMLVTYIIWFTGSVFLASVVSMVFIFPEITGCPFAGPCYSLYEAGAGFVFLVACLVFGPHLISYYIFIFVVAAFFSQLELFRTGEHFAQGLIGILTGVPFRPFFHGAPLAGIFWLLCIVCKTYTKSTW